MLCAACCEFRFPVLTNDNVNNAGCAAAHTVVISTPSKNKNVVKCELLCFLQEKSAVMTADHIIKLCADFYSKDEISEARSLIDQHVPQRLPRRKGADFSRLTVQDLLKACIDPNVALPDFFAKSIDRLPPVDATHCDVSAILKELQALRSEVRQSSELRAVLESTTANELQLLRTEVRELKELRDEFALLRSEAVELKQLQDEVVVLKDTVNKLSHSEARDLKEVRDDIVALKQAVNKLQSTEFTPSMPTTNPSVAQSSSSSVFGSLKDIVNKLQSKPVAHLPSTSLVNLSADASVAVSGDNEILTTTPSSVSFASLARDLQSAPGNQFSSAGHGKKPTRRPAAICGKARDTSSLAVEGVRRADVFITRLRPDTTTANVSELIKVCFPVCTSVKAEKLETRFDTYSSFRVELYVRRSQFDDLISSVYMEDSWPSGILVRRFFRTKDGARN